MYSFVFELNFTAVFWAQKLWDPEISLCERKKTKGMCVENFALPRIDCGLSRKWVRTSLECTERFIRVCFQGVNTDMGTSVGSVSASGSLKTQTQS